MNADKNWKFNIYYAQKGETTCKKITEEQLFDKAGYCISAQLLQEANNRMEYKTIRAVKDFFKHGGKEIILVSHTFRGDIYIEAEEIIQDDI